jgi:transcription elongation factor
MNYTILSNWSEYWRHNFDCIILIFASLQTVGVIFKTERDSFRVLDQNGQVRLVQPHQISMRRDSNRAIATDSEGHELRINDNMKEVDGEVSEAKWFTIDNSDVCGTRVVKV